MRPMNLRAMLACALDANESRYRDLWDNTAPQKKFQVMFTWNDYVERMSRPGAYGSIVEMQVAADATGIRIVVLDGRGRLVEKVTPAVDPPDGVQRLKHGIQGIVLRLEEQHYEWAKVRYVYFSKELRLVTGDMRRGGAEDRAFDEGEERDARSEGRPPDGGDAGSAAGEEADSDASSDPAEWAREFMDRAAIGDVERVLEEEARSTGGGVPSLVGTTPSTGWTWLRGQLSGGPGGGGGKSAPTEAERRSASDKEAPRTDSDA